MAEWTADPERRPVPSSLLFCVLCRIRHSFGVHWALLFDPRRSRRRPRSHASSGPVGASQHSGLSGVGRRRSVHSGPCTYHTVLTVYLYLKREEKVDYSCYLFCVHICVDTTCCPRCFEISSDPWPCLGPACASASRSPHTSHLSYRSSSQATAPLPHHASPHPAPSRTLG